MAEIPTAALTIAATAGLTEASKQSVSLAARSVINRLSNCSSDILMNPQVYTYSGNPCGSAMPTVRRGVTAVCAFGHTIGTACGAVAVLTYDIVDHQRMKVKRLAIMFSVPFDYASYESWFALGLFGIDQSCNASLYEQMYYNAGNFTRGKASGSEICYEGSKFTLRGTMTPVAKAEMRVELLDDIQSENNVSYCI